MSEHYGPTIVDHEAGEPIDGGCAMHSAHWLAKAVRSNRRGLGLPPQECQQRAGCPEQPATAPRPTEAEGGEAL